MPFNLDRSTIEGFGDEWSTYTQSDPASLEPTFRKYFSIFPWHLLDSNSVGFDLGCGSGRWSYFVAPKVGSLYCIDASSKALSVARQNLAVFENVIFENATIEDSSIPDLTCDFGYSLGVLHHIPDPLNALSSSVSKLKKGAPFLLYVYYNLEGKPLFFRTLWLLSDLFRKCISRLPFRLKVIITRIIAVLVYQPLALLSSCISSLGIPTSNLPLSEYRGKTLNFMMTDSLDRFGTRLEIRFSKSELIHLMTSAGLERITISDSAPFWLAVGYKS